MSDIKQIDRLENEGANTRDKIVGASKIMCPMKGRMCQCSLSNCIHYVSDFDRFIVNKVQKQKEIAEKICSLTGYGQAIVPNDILPDLQELVQNNMDEILQTIWKFCEKNRFGTTVSGFGKMDVIDCDELGTFFNHLNP